MLTASPLNILNICPRLKSANINICLNILGLNDYF